MWGQPRVPGQASGYGGPVELSVPRFELNLPPMAAAVQAKPKFFGRGGAGRTIAGIIGDALLGAGGGAPVYAPAMREKRLLQQKQEQQDAELARRETEYGRTRADRRADALEDRTAENETWQAREQWKLDNAPVEIDKPLSVAPGTVLFDPRTRQPIYTNPNRPVYRDSLDANGNRVILEMPGGGGSPAPVARGGGFNPVGLPGERVTSTYRTPEHNRRVGGVANSFHTRRDANGNPLAIDSLPPAGMSMAAYAAQLRRINPGLDVINEGDHVHREPRGGAPGRATVPSGPRVAYQGGRAPRAAPRASTRTSSGLTPAAAAKYRADAAVAIGRGADPAKVNARLKAMGVM